MSYLLLCDVCGCTWASELGVRTIISFFLDFCQVSLLTVAAPGTHSFIIIYCDGKEWHVARRRCHGILEQYGQCWELWQCDQPELWLCEFSSGTSYLLSLTFKLSLRLTENKGKERTEGGVLLLPPVCTDNNFGLYHVLKAELREIFCHSRLIRVQSEDSMEHLSAEERACLMYLEETIEALEVQEDSGLSNDEPESLSQSGKLDETRVRGR